MPVQLASILQNAFLDGRQEVRRPTIHYFPPRINKAAPPYGIAYTLCRLLDPLANEQWLSSPFTSSIRIIYLQNHALTNFPLLLKSRTLADLQQRKAKNNGSAQGSHRSAATVLRKTTGAGYPSKRDGATSQKRALEPQRATRPNWSRSITTPYRNGQRPEFALRQAAGQVPEQTSRYELRSARIGTVCIARGSQRSHTATPTATRLSARSTVHESGSPNFSRQPARAEL